MEKKPTKAAYLGLALGAVLAILTVTFYTTGLYKDSWTQTLAFVVLFAGVMCAVFLHAKQVQYKDTFGQLFTFGLKVTAAATIVMVLYTAAQGYIFPEMKSLYLAAQREAQYAHPESALHKEEIEQNLLLVDSNYGLIMVLAVMFWFLIIGAIGSLVGAALPKKREVSIIRNY